MLHLMISCWKDGEDMFGKKKTSMPKVEFDRENQYAVLKCSICNGEKVAGFKDLHTRKFTEVMLVRNETDLQQFMELYHLESVEKEY